MIRHKAMIHGERGVGALEIALMLPLLLILLLSFLQIGLMIQASFIVNHSAMAAIRSAIVTIPATVSSNRTRLSEARNEIRLNDAQSPKLLEIQRAAAFVLISISPRSSPGGGRGAVLDGTSLGSLSRVLQGLAALSGNPNLSTEMIERAGYAYHPRNTRIEIIPVSEKQKQGRFLDHDDVTVRVIYRYRLVVPGAARLFGRRDPDGGYYFEITSQYTLPIEGEPLITPTDRQRSLGTAIIIPD
jgi:hypothetical protein